MASLEERLSRSLQERAGDVEPTPALWQRVDQRIARRRRLTVLGWVGATAAAVLVGLAVIPPLLPETLAPEVADAPEQPDTPGEADTTDPEEEPGDPQPPTDGDGPASPDQQPPSVVAASGAVVTAAGNQLRVLDAEGAEVAALELPEEGGSTVRGLAVRPGSTVADLTAAVFTTAEGMEDLRVLRVVDGELSLEVVEDDRYRPGAAAQGQPWVDGPVWAPDGTSLAWVEQDDAGTRLHTIGWDEQGPGTGVSATDNATFTLDGDPAAELVLMDWIEVASGEYVVRAVPRGPGEGWVHIPLLRQADDAWAQEPGATVVAVDAPEEPAGPVRALAGTASLGGGDGDGAPQPAWLVRSTATGPVAVRLPDTVVPLPADLFGEDEEGDAWAEVLGDELLVGSAASARAVVVGPAGVLGVLEGPVELLAPIR